MKFNIVLASVVAVALIYYFGIMPLLKKRKTKQWKGVEQQGAEDFLDIVRGVNDNIDTRSQND